MAKYIIPMDSEIVCVEWVDSRGAGANWNFAKDIEKDGICIMESIGRVLYSSDQEICIAPHWGIEEDGDNQVCGEMHIPLVSIVNVQKLTVKKSAG